MLQLPMYLANVAHLVRASGCGSEGRGFDPLHSPQEIIRKDFRGSPFYLQNCRCTFIRKDYTAVAAREN